LKRSQIGEFRCVCAQLLIKLIRVQGKVVLWAGRVTADAKITQAIKLLWVRYRQGFQHHRVHQCENRRVRANSQREGYDRDRSETGAFPQTA
jgi:hypothetical protein